MELGVTNAVRVSNNSNDQDIVNHGDEAEGGDQVEPVSDKAVRPKRKATERFNWMLKESLEYL